MADSVYSKAGEYVVVVDSLGYADETRGPSHAARGETLKLDAEDVVRLSQMDADHGLYPSIAEPKSHAAEALSGGPISAQISPEEGRRQMRAAWELDGPTLRDPAGVPVDVPSTDPGNPVETPKSEKKAASASTPRVGEAASKS